LFRSADGLTMRPSASISAVSQRILIRPRGMVVKRCNVDHLLTINI
jgi:hypothetical protein